MELRTSCHLAFTCDTVLFLQHYWSLWCEDGLQCEIMWLWLYVYIITRTNKFMGICRDIALEPKHKVFLSHNDAQRDFVESLSVDLERHDRYPFLLDKLSSLQMVSPLSFEAIDQCYVGVVILSDGFFTSKRPMMELVYMLDKLEKGKSFFHILPVFYSISAEQFVINQSRWLSCWKEWARQDKRVNVEKCEAALKHIRSRNGLTNRGDGEVSFREAIVGEICRLVPAETRFDDSHFKGRSRICKAST